MKWTPESPNGAPEAGVTVVFFTSREAFASGTAAYDAITDDEGKVVFATPEAGTTYYVVAEKGELSNVINLSAELVESKRVGFIADGLFQTQSEIDAHATQAGRTG